MPILRLKPEWTLTGVPQVQNQVLPAGIEGNLKTIDIMCEVARARATHPKVRQLALTIIRYAGCNSQDYYNEAQAIGEYVQAKVAYVRDPQGTEQLHDPLTLIEQLERGVAAGDCDDMSLLIATLLLSIGCQPYFRAVRYREGAGSFNHIYVWVNEKNHDTGKKRLVLDAIMKRKKIGSEIPHSSGEDFKV